MAGEGAQIKLQATAKLEKYPVGTKSEDIRTGKVKPEEVLNSEDILVDPTEAQLKRLEKMGMKIAPEIWELAKER